MNYCNDHVKYVNYSRLRCKTVIIILISVFLIQLISIDFNYTKNAVRRLVMLCLNHTRTTLSLYIQCLVHHYKLCKEGNHAKQGLHEQQDLHEKEGREQEKQKLREISGRGSG